MLYYILGSIPGKTNATEAYLGKLIKNCFMDKPPHPTTETDLFELYHLAFDFIARIIHDDDTLISQITAHGIFDMLIEKKLLLNMDEKICTAALKLTHDIISKNPKYCNEQIFGELLLAFDWLEFNENKFHTAIELLKDLISKLIDDRT